ncbi:hypothetical protein ID866_7088 [Astraeus odoratus]|nr:hypothetical protein ID866_7088 [Astraeus odoratus]
MPNPQLIHTGDPAYASPVIRAPSPASSIGTAYEPDQTSQSDAELSKEEFEQKWLAKLNLDGLTIEEGSESSTPFQLPLLIDPAPPEGSPDEKLMYAGVVDIIIQGLRTRVQQLEADTAFQQLLVRGSQVGLDKPPSNNSIDTLMANMMPTKAIHGEVSDGPWNRRREDSNVNMNFEATIVKGKE